MTGPRGPDAPGPRSGRPRAALAAAAVALALLAGALRWHPPQAEVLYPDAAVYMRQAQGYLDGHASIAPPWLRVPGGGPVYPALSALLAPAAGGVEAGGVWASRLGGVLTVLGVAALALAVGGPVAGLAAGLLAAVEPRLIHLAERDLTDSLFLGMSAVALAWAHRAATRPVRPAEAAALGLWLGLAALTRVVGVIGVGVVPLLMVPAGRGAGVPWRTLLGRALRVLAAGALVVAAYQGVAASRHWITAFDSHRPAFAQDLLQALDAEGDFPAGDAGPDAAAEAPVAPRVAGKEGLAGVPRTLARQGVALAGMLPALPWLGAGAGVVFLWLDRRRGRAAAVLLLGWAAAYLAALALLGSALARYLVAVFPIAFVAAGAAFGWLAGPVAAWRRGAATALRGGAGVVVAGLAAFLVQGSAHPGHGSAVPVYRPLADAVRAAVPLAGPVYVYDPHGFLAYYLNGYLRAWPEGPEAVAADGGASHVVLLNSDFRDRWGAAWLGPVAAGTAAGALAPAVEQFLPRYHRLLTVYADGPPRATGDGARLLAEGRLAAARRAFAAAGDAAAERGLGAADLAAGAFYPERLQAADAHYRRADEAGPAAADAGPAPERVWWARPPGEVYLDTGEAATDWNRAALALALGRPREALDHAARLAPRLGDDARLAYLAGLAFQAAGDRDRATATLKIARTGLPDDPGVAVAWGNQMAVTGRFDEAVDAYQQVLAQDPRNTGVWLNLAHARSDAGDQAGARAALERARDLPLRPEQRAYLDGLERALGGAPGAAGPDG